MPSSTLASSNRMPKLKRFSKKLRSLKLTSILLNLSARIIEMTSNFRSHSIVRTMPSILVQFTWDHQRVNQLESSSIPVVSTLLSPVFFAMTKLQEITSLRNTTHFPEVSFREIKCTRDARQWLTICINPTLTRFSPRPLPN